jgi:hypothetical protein
MERGACAAVGKERSRRLPRRRVHDTARAARKKSLLRFRRTVNIGEKTRFVKSVEFVDRFE